MHTTQESRPHRRRGVFVARPDCAIRDALCPGKLIVRGNAAATADNILAHETMFRLSIFGDLIGHVIFICLAIRSVSFA